METLFNQITEITGDRIASAKIFLKLNDYIYHTENLINENPQPEEECVYSVNSKDLDFGSYVFDNFVEEDWAQVK